MSPGVSAARTGNRSFRGADAGRLFQGERKPAVGLTGRHVSREEEDERPPAPARRFAGQGNRSHFEQFGGFQSVQALRQGCSEQRAILPSRAL
ncbi:Hypothetical predicted protein [Lynx pardinus]|uniref:Uncharacterized protein n=1 Tax=Lynx pardinus TaxID=191816 RepID=A0A485P654_LYNPA|nr:Hypothetical predicted protein [Lynx pardinus]